MSEQRREEVRQRFTEAKSEKKLPWGDGPGGVGAGGMERPYADTDQRRVTRFRSRARVLFDADQRRPDSDPLDAPVPIRLRQCRLSKEDKMRRRVVRKFQDSKILKHRLRCLKILGTS